MGNAKSTPKKHQTKDVNQELLILNKVKILGIREVHEIAQDPTQLNARVFLASVYMLLLTENLLPDYNEYFLNYASKYLLSACERNYTWAFLLVGNLYLLNNNPSKAREFYLKIKTITNKDENLPQQDLAVVHDKAKQNSALSNGFFPVTQKKGMIGKPWMHARMGYGKTFLYENRDLSQQEIDAVFFCCEHYADYLKFENDSYIKDAVNIKNDITKLNDFVNKMYRQNHPRAKFLVAKSLYHGKNLDGTECEKNQAKALVLLEQLSQDDNVEVLCLIGDYYHNVLNDKPKASEYFSKAAKLPCASNICLFMYARFKAEVLKIYLENNYTEGMAKLYLLLKTDDKTVDADDIFYTYKNSGDNWRSISSIKYQIEYAIYEIHRNGAGGHPKDLDKAIAYLNAKIKESTDSAMIESYRFEIEKIRKEQLHEFDKSLQSSPTSANTSKSGSNQHVVPSAATAAETKSFIIDYGKLEIKSILGEGAFGKVYYAKSGYEEYAVKELKMQNLNEKALQEFQFEAEVMEKLRSANIISLRGICIQPYCLVMEYAPKGSLYGLLQSKEEIAWPKRLKISVGIGKGLAYLHSQNPQILHRDLKSMNVLLDKNYDAKLTDFGLAKIKSDSTSKVTMGAAGTPAWMAPELFGDVPHHTVEADIYSFAIILWEIATRSIPFQGLNIAQIALKITQGKRPEFAQDSTSIEFYSTVTNAWKQKPEERTKLNEIINELESQANEENPAKLNPLESVGFLGASSMHSPVDSTGFLGAPSLVKK